MSLRAGIIAVLLGLGVATLAAAPKESKLEAAVRAVGQAAQKGGASDGEVRQAVSVLRQLVESGVPVQQARDIVTAALAGNHSGQDIAAIARGAADAHRRGASSHELVNLAEDLTASGVDAAGLVHALDAVGRLAEEGYTDAETRRGVAMTALQQLHDGRRGRELSEAIREETRDARDERGDPHGYGAAAASSHGHEGSKDKTEVRDDLRRNPPKGAPVDRGPARDRGNPGRGKPEDRDKPDKPDKPDNPGGGNGKK